jgi:large subunit ribosomal protein L29
MASSLKAHELDDMNEIDLETRLREAKEELFNLRFQAATGQLESHGRLRTVKKDIARIYTVVRERELGIRSVPGTDQQRPGIPARSVRASWSATRWTRPSWSRSRTG